MMILKKVKWFFKTQTLLIFSLIGIAFGISVGFLLNKFNASIYWYMWLGLPGELFLNALQMAIIPVIVANLILMSSRIDISQQGRILGIVLLYSILIGFLGSFIGIILTVSIQPGITNNNSTNIFNNSLQTTKIGFHEMISDLFRNIVPSNLVDACLSTVVTKIEYTRSNDNSSIPEFVVGKVPRTNLIGLMACSIVFGMIARKGGKKTLGFLTFVEGVSIISTDILKLLLKTMPVGVFSLMVTAFAKIGKVGDVFRSMGLFIATVLTALLLIHLVIHPLIYTIFVRKNPVKFLAALIKPWFMGFTVLSSMITIPELQQSLIKFGIRENIVKLAIPVSLGIGACGSITFVSCACVFIAQMEGEPLSIGSLISLGLITPINVTALPAVPSASIMGIIVLLESLNSSARLVPVLFATEFILDRFRTGTNVVSIGLGCALVEHFKSDHQVTPSHNEDSDPSNCHLTKELIPNESSPL